MRNSDPLFDEVRLAEVARAARERISDQVAIGQDEPSPLSLEESDGAQALASQAYLDSLLATLDGPGQHQPDQVIQLASSARHTSRSTSG